MASPKTRQFRELESQWYQTLEATGFQDIEDTKSEGRLLRSWHSFKFKKFDRLQVETIKSYYEQADEILANHEFENEDQRQIWEEHCNGTPEREIAKKVGRYKKSMIHNVIALLSRQIK